jgi:hypothetical protein
MIKYTPELEEKEKAPNIKIDKVIDMRKKKAPKNPEKEMKSTRATPDGNQLSYRNANPSPYLSYKK